MFTVDCQPPINLLTFRMCVHFVSKNLGKFRNSELIIICIMIIMIITMIIIVILIIITIMIIIMRRK